MENTIDRRESRRYSIVIALRYRVSEVGLILKWRAARTCDLSSAGVSFLCRHTLSTDTHLEMVIDWPSNNPISLRAAGHVVRSHDGKVAVYG
jgi:PilZ domain